MAQVEWRGFNYGYHEYMIKYPEKPEPNETTIYLNRETMEKLYHALGRQLACYWDVDGDLAIEMMKKHDGKHPILGTKK